MKTREAGKGGPISAYWRASSAIVVNRSSKDMFTFDSSGLAGGRRHPRHIAVVMRIAIMAH